VRNHEGLAAAKLNDGWQYIDKTGTFVIPPTYENAGTFDGGIARVYLRDERARLTIAFINTKGATLYRQKTGREVRGLE
jgi:hypothetical protein